MEVRCQAEALSLLYLNPPHDWEAGESNNQRLETVFLAHTYPWLKPGGVLLFVIPQLRGHQRPTAHTVARRARRACSARLECSTEHRGRGKPPHPPVAVAVS